MDLHRNVNCRWEKKRRRKRKRGKKWLGSIYSGREFRASRYFHRSFFWLIPALILFFKFSIFYFHFLGAKKVFDSGRFGGDFIRLWGDLDVHNMWVSIQIHLLIKLIYKG